MTAGVPICTRVVHTMRFTPLGVATPTRYVVPPPSEGSTPSLCPAAQACSSSLVAGSCALSALRGSVCSSVLVGGVNLTLMPDTNLMFQAAGGAAALRVASASRVPRAFRAMERLHGRAGGCRLQAVRCTSLVRMVGGSK